MSSRDPLGLDRRSLILMPLALAACGFRPAYGPGGVAEGLRGKVRVNDPVEKHGFDFVDRIEKRLGRPRDARYDLSYTIGVGVIGIGYTPDSAITRYNLTGSVDWTLTDHASAQRVTGGRVENFTSYSATQSTVAGLAAEEDARRRLMVILADEIVQRMLATAGTWMK